MRGECRKVGGAGGIGGEQVSKAKASKRPLKGGRKRGRVSELEEWYSAGWHAGIALMNSIAARDLAFQKRCRKTRQAMKRRK